MLLPYKTNFSQIPFKSQTEKCIVLDLDETLVHTSDDFKVLKRLGIYERPEFLDLRKRVYTLSLDDVVSKNGQGVRNNLWGITRPHYKEFLIACFSYFKIVAVWSAGQRKYVDAIVDYLFKDLPRPHVVYSYNECAQGEDRYLIKPLKNMINQVPGLSKYMSLKNTFVIDDRDYTFSDNPNNGILIPGYQPRFVPDTMRSDDIALAQLMKWFRKPEVMKSKDVRLLDKSQIFKTPL